MEEAKINTQIHPNVFGNQLIPLEELEKNSGSFQIENEDQNIKNLDLLEKNSGSFQINDEYNIIPNLTLLTSSVKPFDQVLELDEEWNYDVLHTEIGQIVRNQYGEFYQK